MKEQKTLMTEGRIWKILIRFAFPLLLGNLFQQLYNAVDSLVVGNFCGDDALAAVSSSGSMTHLLIGFFQGVFVGASVIISRRYGAKDEEGVDEAVHTTIVFSLVTGILLSVLGVVFTPMILRWMGTPENVLPNSVLYFRIYCMGLLGLVLYNTSNGIFQALGDSRHPLYYLIISSLVNVVLDLLFVGVFHMGVAGAALATVLGQCLSAVLGFLHLMSGKFVVKVELKRLAINTATLLSVFSLGIPSGLQNCINSAANLVVQSNINKFGDIAMAGCGSYSKIQAFVFIPVLSLALALTTFVGQNIGAGRMDRVRKGIKEGTWMSVGMAELFGISVWFLAPVLVGMFSKNPQVVSYGVMQARTECLFFFLLAFTHAASGALRGLGETITPMIITISVWCVLRIAYITILIRRFHDIRVVFSAYPVTWMISSALLLVFLAKNLRKEIGELHI